jgi:hypothetical protein
LSPLATAMRMPLNLASVTPALDVVVLSMKLWVEPKSNKVMRWASLTETRIAMVRLACGWMPVSAWMEMVNSPSSGESPSVSSSTTSMMKSCLRCSRWPDVKSSSHLKHLLSLRR